MTYQEQKDTIKDKVVGVYNDVSDRAGNVADKARSEGAAAKRDVFGAANDIAGRAVDAISKVDTDSVRNSLDAIGKSLRGQIRERPLGSLAVAAAIGLVLGVMSNR